MKILARFSLMPGLALMGLLATLFFSGCSMIDQALNNKPENRELATSSDESDERRRARIRLELATNYYQQRQFNTALDEIKQALALDNTLAEAYGVRALVYMEIGEKQLAGDNFSRALSLKTNDPDINNNYGWYLCQNGRIPESYAYFSRAAAVPIYATPAKSLATAGFCATRARDFVAAENFYNQAFRIDPSNLDVSFNLANLYLRKNDVERAHFYARRVIGAMDASAQTLWLSVRLARKQKDAVAEQAAATQLRRRFANTPEYDLLQRGAYDN